MNEIELSKSLGWFSLALGAVELVAGGRLSRALGLGQSDTLVRAFGAREIAAGAMILAHPDAATPVWSRVAGDALDLAVLGSALRTADGRRKPAAVFATLAVVGVTVIDVVCACALAGRQERALLTAERTRVRH